MKKLISLLFFVAILSSCEKEIDYQIPDPGDKIVVSSLLNAGEAPIIYLSTSVYSMSAGRPKTSNIYSAKLFTNHPDSPFELEAKLDPDGFDSLFYYTSSHIISEGVSYRLEVSAPGLEPVSVSTAIPNKSIIENARYDTATRELRFNFNDPSNSANFYWVEIISANQSYPLFFSSADPTLEFFDSYVDPLSNDTEGRSYGIAAFFDDNQFNGQNKEVSIRTEDFSVNDFYVYLHSISESYYRFRITEAASSFSDGFFSEPVQLFSNVKGGYGIMSGQSSDRSLISF